MQSLMRGHEEHLRATRRGLVDNRVIQLQGVIPFSSDDLVTGKASEEPDPEGTPQIDARHLTTTLEEHKAQIKTLLTVLEQRDAYIAQLERERDSAQLEVMLAKLKITRLQRGTPEPDTESLSSSIATLQGRVADRKMRMSAEGSASAYTGSEQEEANNPRAPSHEQLHQTAELPRLLGNRHNFANLRAQQDKSLEKQDRNTHAADPCSAEWRDPQQEECSPVVIARRRVGSHTRTRASTSGQGERLEVKVGTIQLDPQTVNQKLQKVARRVPPMLPLQPCLSPQRRVMVARVRQRTVSPSRVSTPQPSPLVRAASPLQVHDRSSVPVISRPRQTSPMVSGVQGLSPIKVFVRGSSPANPHWNCVRAPSPSWPHLRAPSPVYAPVVQRSPSPSRVTFCSRVGGLEQRIGATAAEQGLGPMNWTKVSQPSVSSPASKESSRVLATAAAMSRQRRRQDDLRECLHKLAPTSGSNEQGGSDDSDCMIFSV